MVTERVMTAFAEWWSALCGNFPSGGGRRPSLADLRPALEEIVATLLDQLTRPDWQQAARQPMMILRFLADQLNLSLPDALTAFLALRNPIVQAVAERLGDEAEAWRRVLTVWDEGILALTTARQMFSQQALELAHQKYLSLFERASDAFLLIRMDEKGTIVEANAAAAELTGYSLQELVNIPAIALVPEEAIAAYRQALAQLRRDGQLRKRGLPLRRRDGQIVSLDLSCAVLHLDGEDFALCVARDITEQVRAQERLQRLIDEKTKELQIALERERHRAAQLAVLSAVAAKALTVTDPTELFRAAVDALFQHLAFYNVAIFVADKERRQLALAACRGAYEKVWTSDYRQPIEVGLIGWVARHGEPLLVNEVAKDPRYFCAVPEEGKTQAELVMPIKSQGEVIGVIDLQSDVKDAFDDEDLRMAQAVADQIAHALQALQNFQRVRILRELNEQIVRNLPNGVALLNEQGEIIVANESFCHIVCELPSEQVLNRPVREVLPTSLWLAFAGRGVDLDTAIRRALEQKEPSFFPEIPYRDGWWDVRVLPIHGDGRRRVMLYLRDASTRVRRIYQLETLLAIGQAMESTIDLNRLLHAILTAATAGPGLGFNRAILFLVDKEAQVLRVAMAVGTLTAEEAYATWTRLAAERKTLWDFLREYPGDEAIRQTPLMQRVQDLVIRLDEENLLTLCLQRHEPLRITNPQSDPRLPERLRQILTDSDAICVPLIAQDEPLGLIVADNAFSRHPITEESERLLRLFAASASIALRNAQLIAQLRQSLQREKEMREQLLHSERLAVIGELATKIAHDLRSPLVTIGGYARQLQRHPDDAERVRRNAQIIVDEVERLERQLRDLLDFTTPRPPQLKPASLGELVQRLAELQRPSLEAARVTFTLDIPDHLPPVLIDELQMERVILNLWRNAVEAMPDGGTLSVRVWQEGDWVKLQVADTGEGIPAEVMENIFQPFFTTKRTGSGLGLAICEKIVTDHGGTIRLSSTVGQGTVVEIALPVAKSE